MSADFPLWDEETGLTAEQLDARSRHAVDLCVKNSLSSTGFRLHPTARRPQVCRRRSSPGDVPLRPHDFRVLRKRVYFSQLVNSCWFSFASCPCSRLERAHAPCFLSFPGVFVFGFTCEHSDPLKPKVGVMCILNFPDVSFNYPFQRISCLLYSYKKKNPTIFRSDGAA